MNAQPPTNLQAEQAALACALTDDQSARALAQFPASLFYVEKHRTIHRVVCDRVQEKGRTDLVETLTALSGTDVDQAYVTDLVADGQYSYSCMGEYLDLIRQAARQRHLRQVGENLAQRASERLLSEKELVELESEIQRQAFDLGKSGRPRERKPRHIQDVLHDTFTEIQERQTGTRPKYGITTGFHELDMQTAGLNDGDLIIIAGRPSMGKTAFALNMVLAASHDRNVLVKSLEMSDTSLGQRLLASRARLNLRNVRTGELGQEQWNRLVEAMGDLSEMGIWIDKQLPATPAELRYRIMELAVTQPIDMVVIDYLQLMSPSQRQQTREATISSISRELKLMAMDLKIPVVVLSQLSREVEKRTDRRPILSDLRESGAIEQDADLIVFLFRPFYYTGNEAEARRVECNVAKQRNGPVGTLILDWDASSATFRDAAPAGR